MAGGRGRLPGPGPPDAIVQRIAARRPYRVYWLFGQRLVPLTQGSHRSGATMKQTGARRKPRLRSQRLAMNKP
jgi:hypothetical protein